MAYTIYNNDGSVLLTLGEGKVDSVTTSLDLIGKNVNNYGEAFNTNLIRLLTNSAAPNNQSPRSPQVGQLWFNTTTKRLTVYDGTTFKPTSGSAISDAEPLLPTAGDFWFDRLNGQLKIYDGSQYRLIAPSYTVATGKIGIEAPSVSIRSNINNIPQKVAVIYSYGGNVGLISTSSFSMSTASSAVYFGTNTSISLVSGVTLLQDLDIRGDLYVRGSLRTPDKSLSIYYDISGFGDPRDTGASASQIQTRINNANNAIRTDLNSLFPGQSSTQYDQLAYQLGSEARVLCNFNGTTSIRRFRLESRIPNVPNWEPYDLYFNDFSNSLTNIVI
jgi:hypothetical protein